MASHSREHSKIWTQVHVIAKLTALKALWAGLSFLQPLWYLLGGAWHREVVKLHSAVEDSMGVVQSLTPDHCLGVIFGNGSPPGSATSPRWNGTAASLQGHSAGSTRGRQFGPVEAVLMATL